MIRHSTTELYGVKVLEHAVYIFTCASARLEFRRSEFDNPQSHCYLFICLFICLFVCLFIYYIYYSSSSSFSSSSSSSLSYFSFQPVLHDWCNKGRGMWYPVCGMMHIKEPLLMIEKKVAHEAATGFLSS